MIRAIGAWLGLLWAQVAVRKVMTWCACIVLVTCAGRLLAQVRVRRQRPFEGVTRFAPISVSDQLVTDNVRTMPDLSVWSAMQ